MFTSIRSSTLSLSLFATCLLLPHALALPHTNHLPTSNLLDRATQEASSPIDFVTPPYTPPPTYNGDAINVTKCYCQDPASGDPSPKATTGTGWGHYYRLDYWNFHAKQLYTLDLNCSSSSVDKHVIPACWKGDGKKHSLTSGDGNVFSYKESKASFFGDGKLEHIYFNDQKRGLPNNNPGIDLDTAPPACDGFCMGMVNGMVVAKDPPSPLTDGYTKTWYGDKGRVLSIQSSFVSYTDLDDMCKDCK